MKRVIVFLLFVFAFVVSKAQFSVGADVVSNYVFRGVVQDDGNGAIQPSIEYAVGGFTIGTWGSYATGSGTLSEADLYLSYALSDKFSFGLSDYYYPSGSWFEFDEDVSTHSIEVNVGYTPGKFSLSGNYIVNNSTNTQDGSYYFEAGYAFNDMVSLAVGGGNGWCTKSYGDEFEICNVCLTVSKEIAVTEKWSVPVFGQAILNPNTEAYHIVFGFSL